jgi:vacuolar-type H+-ATPase subunit E/Vma4
MRGMEKIGEAILDKVKAEAYNIIAEAESKAEEEIEKAKTQLAAKQEAEKDRMLQEAREEATRIEAQALVKARQELSTAKAAVVDEIISRVKKGLSGVSGDSSHLMELVKESTEILGISKGRVYVSAKDKNTVEKLLEKDKELASKIVEIREHEGMGGIIVEDSTGKTRIDNTYETRLEMLLPKLLPEVGKELF